MQKTSKPIFQSTFFPPVQQIAHISCYSEIMIEQHDTYSKQTFRNRLQIAGPNGIQNLSIPVEKPYGSKTRMKDIVIKNATDWQTNMIRSIKTAYKNSPFYEFYIDDFIPFFEQKFDRLIDLNLKVLSKILITLEIETSIDLSKEYMHDYQNDYRDIVHPKPQFRKPDSLFTPEKYHQLFEDKHGFIPNLSILDLIFNEGPLSYFYIKNSMR